MNLKVRCGSVQIKVMNSQNKTLFKEMPRVGFKPTTLCRRVLYLLSYQGSSPHAGTVQPPKKEQYEDDLFVPSREVVLFRRFSLLHVFIATVNMWCCCSYPQTIYDHNKTCSKKVVTQFRNLAAQG